MCTSPSANATPGSKVEAVDLEMNGASNGVSNGASNGQQVGSTSPTAVSDLIPVDHARVESGGEPEIGVTVLDAAGSAAPVAADLPPGKNPHLMFTGKFMGGLKFDLAQRMPFYKSDWLDGVSAQNRGKVAASSFFLFFACISPALSFGVMFEEETKGQLGLTEMILSSGLSGIIYAFFAGQPLCILGATGPELAYTVVFYQLCNDMGIEFLSARVWQGLWTALFTILLALTDSCALMKYCSRYTEDLFSAIISLIFIINALRSTFKELAMKCVDNTKTEWDECNVDDRLNHGLGELPDKQPVEIRARAFLTIIICFFTFGLAYWLKHQKNGTLGCVHFNKRVRTYLSDYSPVIAVITMSVIAAVFKLTTHDADNDDESDLQVPTLQLPNVFTDGLQPSWTIEEVNPDTNATTVWRRPWFVNPMGVRKDIGAGEIFITMPLALGLTILGYMDQNLTSLLINRKDHKLKKPPAYHLDLLVCGVFIYPICGFLGLPFTHAATVRSLTHYQSLQNVEMVPDEKAPGGVRRTITNVAEQRVSQLLIHIFILLSLVLSVALEWVPKAALYGIFLFMGICSMKGNEVFERIWLFFIWDTKLYPQYEYVKKVALKKVHIFTGIQLVVLFILYAFSAKFWTTISVLGIVFPFALVVLPVSVRHWMEKSGTFTTEELALLDS